MLSVIRLGSENQILNSAFTQIVRWRRKPRWIPTAKSKLYKVPVRPVVPEEERLELQRLHTNYKTQIKAIRSYLIKEYEAQQVIADESQIKKAFEIDFAKCSDLNKQWNESIKPTRDARVEKERQIREENIFKSIDYQQELEKQKLEIADQVVRAEKEKAKSFITAKNIDAAIEAALAQTVNYNYNIDLEGKFLEKNSTDVVPK